MSLSKEELRVAAQRLIENRYDLVGELHTPEGTFLRSADADSVARAYLAEHADDGEAVTEEWAKENADFVNAEGNWFCWDIIGDLEVWFTTEETPRLIVQCAEPGQVVCNNPTRGHLRRLLAALGIERKDGGE